MERIIQPYPHPRSGAPIRPESGATSLPFATSPHPPKTAADFARALRRRVWIILLVALAVIVPGAVYLARLPDQYRATAQIKISPPKFDPGLVSFIVHASVATVDRETADKYVPDQWTYLKSRSLAEKVIVLPTIGAAPGFETDPATEILGGFHVQRIPSTNTFDVHLEGPDPSRAAKVLKTLIETFREDARLDTQRALDASIAHAQASVKELENHQTEGLKAVQGRIDALVNQEAIFAPNGKNLIEEEYALTKSTLAQKRFRHDDLIQQERLAQLFPHLRPQPPPPPGQKQIDYLLDMRERWRDRVLELRRIAANPDADPAMRVAQHWLKKIDADLERLRPKVPTLTTADLSRMTLSRSAEEIDRLENEVKGLLQRMKESMPAYQQYLNLVRQREQKQRAIETMKARISDFGLLKETQSEPVRLLQPVIEPTSPSGPARAFSLAIVAGLGLALGIVLVCALEWFDHRVKVPEHLTAGLALPLLGVVPRIRRVAQVHRGGHLWAQGAPQSPAADAYRNLRASLLSVASPPARVVTVLVTSAKAGEGKSTTALNLAATCAKAGERTLLVDCDLRRPSLAEVFGPSGPDVGLVDCLRDDLPWQRAVLRTDLTNLDFLPTGDPSGTPIEVLGSLELRQLLAALAGHYDRVILDGPAVLGLADCRMIGQHVDASLLVVRSGAHELRPLQRAKAMLEQSRVPVSGLVLNHLSDDLENWSSDGPDSPYGPPASPPDTVAATLARPSADDEADQPWLLPASAGLGWPSSRPGSAPETSR